jgi:ribosomal protein L37AE/L43A
MTLAEATRQYQAVLEYVRTQDSDDDDDLALQEAWDHMEIAWLWHRFDKNNEAMHRDYERCAQCGSHEPMRFTGRRWLCRQCWAENLGQPFESDTAVTTVTATDAPIYLAGLTNPTVHSTPIGTTD